MTSPSLARAPPLVLLGALLAPGLGPVVVARYAPVELARESPDRVLVPDVGGPQPAAGEPPEPAVGVNEQDAAPHALDLTGGDHSGARPPVNHHVRRQVLGDRGADETEQQRLKHGSVKGERCTDELSRLAIRLARP